MPGLCPVPECYGEQGARGVCLAHSLAEASSVADAKPDWMRVDDETFTAWTIRAEDERRAAAKVRMRAARERSVERRRAWEKREGSRYGLAAAEDHLRRLSACDAGRNNTLFSSALTLARLVYSGHLDEAFVREMLREAGESVGLRQREAMDCITNGFKTAETVGPLEPRPA